jgi:hypothetical protein
MDRGLKIALALSILLGGAGLASLFRRPPSDALSPASGDYEPLVLRGQSRPPGPLAPVRATESPAFPSLPSQPFGTTRQWATTIAPLDPGQPPAPLPRVYPGDPLTASPWGTSLGLNRAADPALETRHTVADGDTLGSLAERYLGRADRSKEIYAANRHQLASPDMLPIGAELVIPPATTPPTVSAGEEEPLVPVR